MRVYKQSRRRLYADVLRAIGSALDRASMRNVLLVEVDEGFIVQGHAAKDGAQRGSGPSIAREQLTFWDADIAREMQQAVDRRGTTHTAGPYERALRVIGHRVDKEEASDVMTFEQNGSWLVRMQAMGSELRYVLTEFTADDILNVGDELLAGRRDAPRRRFVPW